MRSEVVEYLIRHLKLIHSIAGPLPTVEADARQSLKADDIRTWTEPDKTERVCTGNEVQLGIGRRIGATFAMHVSAAESESKQVNKLWRKNSLLFESQHLVPVPCRIEEGGRCLS